MFTLREDILYWLAAMRLTGIGPVRMRAWLELFGEIKNLFSATTAELQTAGLTQLQIEALQQVEWEQVDRDLSWCLKANCHIVTCVDDAYPLLLRNVASAPLVLFVRGNVDLLSQPQIAIVGSRNPTIAGREHAEEFAFYLAKADLVVTSGMALGIDAAAHRGALKATGKTIAVCGSGLQHVYPSSHKPLAEEIMEQGALVSEFLPSMEAKPQYFPMRNRVISGMSLGVLVVEAALRSGSLITANMAVDQGREVFALPGSINNPLSRGCHKLIKLGAKLIETAEDILEELGALKAAMKPKVEPANPLYLDEKSKKVWDLVQYEVTSLDAIILQSGLTAGEVSSMLLSLELEGYVLVAPGGYVRNSMMKHNSIGNYVRNIDVPL